VQLAEGVYRGCGKMPPRLKLTQDTVLAGFRGCRKSLVFPNSGCGRGFYETAGGVNGFLVFFVRRFLFFAFGEAALLYGGFISDFYPHSGGVA
jgi:hypothetical protein